MYPNYCRENNDLHDSKTLLINQSQYADLSIYHSYATQHDLQHLNADIWMQNIWAKTFGREDIWAQDIWVRNAW